MHQDEYALHDPQGLRNHDPQSLTSSWISVFFYFSRKSKSERTAMSLSTLARIGSLHRLRSLESAPDVLGVSRFQPNHMATFFGGI